MPTKLGQNFLKDESAVKKIIESANLSPADFVVEIGPGQGILTKELAKKAGRVLAIEIDHNLIPVLKSKFKNTNNVEIIEGDILKINISELLKTKNHPPAGGLKTYKIVANIPYYITSPIIRLFLESETPPNEMILMVQKEVAERIAARPSEIPAEGRSAKRISRGKPGKMSILAVSVQYYANAEILFEVSKNSFDPVPEVDSTVIKIVPHKSYDKEKDKQFFRIVKAAFAAKRKTLINNLSASLHLEKSVVAEKIKTLGLKPNVRAQELSIGDWKKLAKLL